MTGLSVVKSELKSRSESPCGCSVAGMRRKRSTTLTKRIFKSEKCSLRIATAATDSMVAMSPAQAITTSGSAPSSVEAQSQMPMPLVQWVTASFHGEVLKVVLLVRDNDVDVVARA